MSEPQREMPENPMPRPVVTTERRPSKSHAVVGSPLQTTCAQRAAPVQPERWKRTIGRRCRRAKSWAAQW
jgi:hypothetical protein